MKPTLVLVGCGGIGSALLKGWLSLPAYLGHFHNFWVVAPHEDKVSPFLEDPRVQWFPSPNDLPSQPDVIVFAVKPLILNEVLPLYISFECLKITVAAGKSLDFYKSHQPIVRAMPNLAVSVQRGVIGLYPSVDLSEDMRMLVRNCFQHLGLCLWLSSDEEVDKLTAVSGSGPAYVYYMIESLANAAKSLGFKDEIAKTLALNTFKGAVCYADESNLPPEILRKQVTSPKGTTEAALKVLENGKLCALMEEAVKAAYKRAEELKK